MKAVLNSLTDSELALIRETDRDAVVALDEDALVELHTRVRRARNKFVTLYRREASARVSSSGGRGKARPKNTRNAEKAEVFEDALARVSRQLATAARHSATELRTERIAAARRSPTTAPPRSPRSAAAARTTTGRTTTGRTTARKATTAQATITATQARGDQEPASPALTKRRASSQAMGARRQTRRDSR